MPIKLIRPVVADNSRLYYRTDYTVQFGRVGGHYRGPQFIPSRGNGEKGLFRLMDPDNVIAQLRLYRWFLREYERQKREIKPDYSGMIDKNDLLRQCFEDYPSVNKSRIGRLLRLIVQYETNFQQNRSPSTGNKVIMNWRWSHSLEIAYGLEYLMLLWLPTVIEADGGICATDADFLEELEIIRNQSDEEDRALVSTIVSNRLGLRNMGSDPRNP